MTDGGALWPISDTVFRFSGFVFGFRFWWMVPARPSPPAGGSA
jgi:hypothetical protein